MLHSLTPVILLSEICVVQDKAFMVDTFLTKSLSMAKSKRPPQFSGQKISSVQYMGVNGLHLAIASEDSRVSVVDVKKTSLLTTIGFDKDEEGSPVDLYAVGNLLYVLTHHSNVFCFDCRYDVKH